MAEGGSCATARFVCAIRSSVTAVAVNSRTTKIMTGFRSAEATRLAKSTGFLLPRVRGRFALFQSLRLALADAAKRAGCADTGPISEAKFLSSANGLRRHDGESEDRVALV